MASNTIPEIASVQLIEKGKKDKEIAIGFKEVEISQGKFGFVLETYDSPTSRSAKNSFDLKRVLSELKSQDGGSTLLTLITTTQEITFNFKKPSEALLYHNFICKKSEVQEENKAISQLDDEMRMIWPFPGGSFF